METELQFKTIPAASYKDIKRYYDVAGDDYEFWSKEFNMHFGYYRRWTNPFNRGQMLNEMNKVVLSELHLSPSGTHKILDLGCGLGTTVRYACNMFPLAEALGVTIVPSQVEKANRLTKLAGLERQAAFLIGDYTCLPFLNDSVDGVYAIESSCYATGSQRQELIGEMHRMLKPGSRFAIADGFLKQPISPKGFLRSCYDKICRNWALTEFPQIADTLNTLKETGFRNISAKDISWNVAPSFAHIPFVSAKFLLHHFFSGSKKLEDERKGNMLAPLYGMALGLHRNYFGYYIISGEK